MTSLMPILRSRNLFNLPEPRFFNRLWDDFPFMDFFKEDNTFLPDINVSETEKDIVIKAEVPGIGKDDIDITLSEGLLTIKGEKKSDHEESKENYHLIESRYGSFSRSVRVPLDLKSDDINATYKDGVLKVVLPKSESSVPKKIEVKRDAS